MIRAHEQKGGFFLYGLAREINRRFLVNMHGDLYFLFHNFGVNVVLFEFILFYELSWTIRKKIIGGKKDIVECVYKSRTRGRKL